MSMNRADVPAERKWRTEDIFATVDDWNRLYSELEGKLDGVKNYCVAVREKGEDIVFLRKIVAGGADKSYGIQVARLAGVPESVLTRASQLVAQLSDADITAAVKELTDGNAAKRRPVHYDTLELQQMSLFDF